jgi:hypothetical protein
MPSCRDGMARVLAFDFLLLPARRALLALDLAPSLARLLPLRRALPASLLALHAGLANRSRHGAHPVSMVSWTSITLSATVYGGTGCIAVNKLGRFSQRPSPK